jgi:aldose 1-epimerase
LQPSISKAPFGQLPDGRDATLYTLTNRNGLVVKITDFGGIITEIHAPDRHGALADIVLGYDEVRGYVADDAYFGALIGRYGNRLRDGRFTLDGQTWQLPVNNGLNHLHGGPQGFHKMLWRALPFQEGESVGVTLTRRSLDGEQGYPGTLDVTVVYELNSDNELVMTFDAVTDKATPINLTQHSYFNLAGGGDILGHELSLRASTFTPVDATLVPTGALAAVDGGAFDFRSPRPIGEYIGTVDEQLRYGQGYDHNFVLDRPRGKACVLAARVREPVSGRVLELFTEEPGVQFYSGNFLDGSLRGKGQVYGYRSGFCLEPQHFPDSPNQPAFPTTILRPGEEYATVSRFKFSVER